MREQQRPLHSAVFGVVRLGQEKIPGLGAQGIKERPRARCPGALVRAYFPSRVLATGVKCRLRAVGRRTSGGKCAGSIGTRADALEGVERAKTRPRLSQGGPWYNGRALVRVVRSGVHWAPAGGGALAGAFILPLQSISRRCPGGSTTRNQKPPAWPRWPLFHGLRGSGRRGRPRRCSRL